jgi:hypothetical protein
MVIPVDDDDDDDALEVVVLAVEMGTHGFL